MLYRRILEYIIVVHVHLEIIEPVIVKLKPVVLKFNGFVLQPEILFADEIIDSILIFFQVG